MHLEHLLSQSAKKNPAGIALVDHGQSFTYQELDERVSKLATTLEKHLGTDRHIIGLLFEASIEAFVATQACTRLRRPFVPISPTASQEKIDALLSQTNPDIVLTTAQHVRRVGDITTLQTDTGTFSENAKRSLQIELPEDIAAIIFTSGSSGIPKGVLISYSGWVEMVKTWQQVMSISDYKQFLVMSGFDVAGFFDDMFMVNSVGATMHIVPMAVRRNINQLVTYINLHKLDFLDITPAYVRQLIRHLRENPEANHHQPKLVVVGSEAWFVQEMRDLRTTWPQAMILNSYGLTESIVDNGLFFAHDIREESLSPDELVPIGEPFGTTRFFVLDEEQNLVPDGTIGELHISSAGLSPGYFSAMEQTNFREYQGVRVVKTGDLVVKGMNGLYKLAGRSNQEVKIHGTRVDLYKLEQAFRNDPEIIDIAISHVNRPPSTMLMCFIVSPLSEKSERISNLYQKAVDVSGIPTLPIKFVFVDEIPRRADGKILWSTLQSQALPKTTPGTNIDTYLEIFRKNIRFDTNPDDDIFLHGADSLTIEMINLDLQAAGLEPIPLKAFYGGRSLSKIRTWLTINPDTQPTLVRDIVSDALLPSDFISNKSNTKDSTGSGHFLTGATGFLGIHVLHQLTSADTPVYCLTRANSLALAEEKIIKTWRKYFDDRYPQELVTPILGDLSEPNLGISRESEQIIVDQVEYIYHVGYWVNFLLDYFDLKKVNVQSFDEILRLAGKIKNSLVTFVSSSSTASITSSARLSDFDGYELTKYINEEKLAHYSKLGYRQNIVAPATITPRLERPVFGEHDFFWSFIQSCLEIGYFPNVNWWLDLVPVDEVSQAITAPRQSNDQKILFKNQRPLQLSDAVATISDEANLRLGVLSFELWLKTLEDQLKQGKGKQLAPFFSALKEKGIHFFETETNAVSPGYSLQFASISSLDLLQNYVRRFLHPYAS